MGLFNWNKQKSIDYNGLMIKKFSNFYNWLNSQKNILKTELNISDSTTIEFKLPILTYGRVMGYNYIGVENIDSLFYIYINCVSSRGRKIFGKKINILKDEDIESYNNLIQELVLDMMSNPDYNKISVGSI